jgi:hypothetical protein
VSRAAREPRTAADLPPLKVSGGEAAPSADPQDREARARLAARHDARIAGYQQAMVTAVTAYLDRVLGVTVSRLEGPRVRKGTRWWTDRPTNAAAPLHLPVPSTRRPGTEIKALDAGYALPDRTATEIGDAVRPVGIRIATDAVATVADQLGASDVGLAEFDQQAVDKAVDEMVRQMLGVGRRYAEEIRRAILDADETADTFEQLVEQLRDAHRRGGGWILLSGRTLATALAGEAALAAARSLGATQVEWLSRRDAHVRPTHVAADGQRRDLGDRFQVGEHRLAHPADPSGLPDSWPEVANCRCGLLAVAADIRHRTATEAARTGTPEVAEQVDRIADGIRTANGAMPTPPGAGLPATAPVVRLPAPLAGYRILDEAPSVTAGQWLTVAGVVALALAAPAAPGLLLTVVMPAGSLVGVVAGTAVLPEGTPLEVVSVTDAGVVAVPARISRPPQREQPQP